MKTAISRERLLVCGDWAVAHGNVGGLAVVARDLAAKTSGRLHDELVQVADLCDRNEDLATCRWYKLRSRLRATHGH
jgi:hypothetical protein